MGAPSRQPRENARGSRGTSRSRAGLRTVIESMYAACDEKTGKTIEGGGSLDKEGGSRQCVLVVSAAQAHRGIHFQSQRQKNRAGLQHLHASGLGQGIGGSGDGNPDGNGLRRRHHLYFTIYTSRCNGSESLERDVTMYSNDTRLEYDSNDTRATRAPSPYIYSRAKMLWWRAPNQSRSEATQAMRGPPPPPPLFARHSVSSARQTPILQTFPTQPCNVSTNGFPNPHARSL